MRRLLSVLASSAVFSFGLLAFTAGEARAEDTAAKPAAATPAAPAEKPQASDDEPELKRLSLEINPLGLVIGRYSISGEYMLARHHAVTLTPSYTSTSIKVNDVEVGALSGFGGEAGYRLYTGSKGANGFFVGPSLLVASFTSESVVKGGASQSFTSIGGALDIGGQWIIGPGVVLGFGAGLQYTKNSEELTTDGLNLASAAIAGGGVRPRFLLAVGYSF